MENATFFEITTAIAFMYFSENRPDMSIIEAGLGGGKDTTSIIQPRLSILTSVGLDHIEILGNTVSSPYLCIYPYLSHVYLCV